MQARRYYVSAIHLRLRQRALHAIARHIAHHIAHHIGRYGRRVDDLDVVEVDNIIVVTGSRAVHRGHLVVAAPGSHQRCAWLGSVNDFSCGVGKLAPRSSLHIDHVLGNHPHTGGPHGHALAISLG